MKKNRKSGFTLIELLASTSILVVLAVILVNIVGMVGASWRSGKARIDSFTQARGAMGILDRDLQGIILRSDLAAFTDKNGNLGALAFYTRIKGGNETASGAPDAKQGDRAVSLVEYRIDNQSTAPKLVRCDYGMDYGDASDSRTMTFGESTKLPDLDKVKPTQIRDLALGVVRLEYRFIDGTGTEQTKFIFDYKNPSATTNTRLLRISLLVLDTASSDILLKSPASLSTLLAQTGGSPNAGESQGEFWDRMVNSAPIPGIPQPVSKSLRIFERSLPLYLPR